MLAAGTSSGGEQSIQLELDEAAARQIEASYVIRDAACGGPRPGRGERIIEPRTRSRRSSAGRGFTAPPAHPVHLRVSSAGRRTLAATEADAWVAETRASADV